MLKARPAAVVALLDAMASTPTALTPADITCAIELVMEAVRSGAGTNDTVIMRFCHALSVLCENGLLLPEDSKAALCGAPLAHCVRELIRHSAASPTNDDMLIAVLHAIAALLRLGASAADTFIANGGMERVHESLAMHIDKLPVVTATCELLRQLWSHESAACGFVSSDAFEKLLSIARQPAFLGNFTLLQPFILAIAQLTQTLAACSGTEAANAIDHFLLSGCLGYLLRALDQHVASADATLTLFPVLQTIWLELDGETELTYDCLMERPPWAVISLIWSTHADHASLVTAVGRCLLQFLDVYDRIDEVMGSSIPAALCQSLALAVDNAGILPLCCELMMRIWEYCCGRCEPHRMDDAACACAVLCTNHALVKLAVLLAYFSQDGGNIHALNTIMEVVPLIVICDGGHASLIAEDSHGVIAAVCAALAMAPRNHRLQEYGCLVFTQLLLRDDAGVDVFLSQGGLPALYSAMSRVSRSRPDFHAACIDCLKTMVASDRCVTAVVDSGGLARMFAYCSRLRSKEDVDLDELAVSVCETIAIACRRADCAAAVVSQGGLDSMVQWFPGAVDGAEPPVSCAELMAAAARLTTVLLIDYQLHADAVVSSGLLERMVQAMQRNADDASLIRSCASALFSALSLDGSAGNVALDRLVPAGLVPTVIAALTMGTQRVPAAMLASTMLIPRVLERADIIQAFLQGGVVPALKAYCQLHWRTPAHSGLLRLVASLLIGLVTRSAHKFSAVQAAVDAGFIELMKESLNCEPIQSTGGEADDDFGGDIAAACNLLGALVAARAGCTGVVAHVTACGVAGATLALVRGCNSVGVLTAALDLLRELVVMDTAALALDDVTSAVLAAMDSHSACAPLQTTCCAIVLEIARSGAAGKAALALHGALGKTTQARATHGDACEELRKLCDALTEVMG